MSDYVFLSAVQKITSENLSIGDLINAAVTLTGAGQAALARQLYKIWLSFNRDNPQAYIALFNCSALDGQAGDAAAAMECLRQAIAQNADFMPAYINLGGFLERSGAADQAVELWRTAANRSVPITGTGVSYVTTALKQIARVLSDHHKTESAEAAVQLCLDIDPHQHDIVEQYVALRLAGCKWPVIVPWERVDRKALMRNIHPLSMCVYTDDPLLQLASAERYVRTAGFEGPHSPEFDRRHATIDTSKRRLRVGYVSSDLRDHAIGYLMAELFELHDKKAVEVFAYYCGPESKSTLAARTKAAVEHWIDIKPMSDDEAARRIAADGIDILVDVNGHTRDARTGLFARRPAPVQVNWLGYPGTMGTPYHQYIIADDWIIPQGSEMYYSEKVVRLPCYQPNDRKRVVATEKPTRRDAGLPEDAFVFCCFNGTHKIGRFTFERWMEILNRVPNSVLWLLETSAEVKDRLGAYAESKGIAKSRLVFAPKQHNPLHLARYCLADLFLDTTPYGAHTTASDALWMGVPVLTLSGRSFASRVCGSLVRSAGLPELVVTRPEDFVIRATALGNNRPTVEAYKKKLESTRLSCTLFDTNLLVRKLEELYLTMARAHQNGEVHKPDLANLERYMDAGIDHDHEAQELLGFTDYDGLYKAKLARLHSARPIPPDTRLWTKDDVARAEADMAARGTAPVRKLERQEAEAPLQQRRTGTR